MMQLEEINEVEDKARRLELLKQYVAEMLAKQSRQDDIDHSYDESSMRDEMGGMMSTAKAKTGNS